MNKYDLHIIRHAPSVLNESGIVQGTNFDFGLSANGINALSQAIHAGLLSSEGIQHIISSDSQRARDTATTVAHSLGVKYTTEPLIREVNSGILAGKGKDWLFQNKPSELEIWNKYGDLDGIEGAEKGSEVQARALAFLIKMRETTPAGSYGVVSHAAFIRSLVNTLRGSPRQTVIEHRHLMPISCKDVFGQIPIKQLGPTFTSAVYHVQTYEGDYVVKRADGGSLREISQLNDLLIHMSRQGLQQPLLFVSEYNQSGQDFAITVGPYIEGAPLLTKRSDSDFEDICYLMQNVSKSLQEYKQKNLFADLKDISLKIRSSLGQDDHEERLFMGGDGLKAMFNNAASWGIVDHDCHFGNFIRSSDGRLHKIDLSPVWAPSIYQPASVLLSAFLLNSPGDRSIFKRFVERWPEVEGHIDDLVSAMKLRTVLGIAYFNRVEDKIGYNRDADFIYKKYKACFRALDHLT